MSFFWPCAIKTNQPTLDSMPILLTLLIMKISCQLLLTRTLWTILLKKMTNFICWNCRGFKNKWDEIRDIISDHRPIFFAFQETHLTKYDKVTFCGCSRFKKDYHSGGVTLLISNDFPHIHIPLNTNIQTVAVQIHIRQLITVCTIYLPPNYPLQQHELNNLIM